MSPRLIAQLLLAALFSVSVVLPVYSEDLPPLNAGSIANIDLPASTAKSITLDIEDARFDDESVGRLRLTANGINFRDGHLNGLNANIVDGFLDNTLKVDEFNVSTAAFNFDTLELLNNRRFVLAQPIQASVQMKISEANLNHFFASPNTMGKLEKALQKKTGGIKLIRFANPELKLPGKDRVELNTTMVMGEAVGTPLTMVGKLRAKEGNLAFTDLTVSSSEAAMPVDVAKVIEGELNKMLNLEKLTKKHLAVRASQVKVSKSMLEISGNATMTRLQFGKGKQ